MKRPHRRVHLLIWLAVAPATFVAGLFAWLQRPLTPFTDIPNSVEQLDQGGE